MSPYIQRAYICNPNYIGREMQQVLEVFVVPDSIGKRVDPI